MIKHSCVVYSLRERSVLLKYDDGVWQPAQPFTALDGPLVFCVWVLTTGLMWFLLAMLERAVRP